MFETEEEAFVWLRKERRELSKFICHFSTFIEQFKCTAEKLNHDDTIITVDMEELVAKAGVVLANLDLWYEPEEEAELSKNIYSDNK